MVVNVEVFWDDVDMARCTKTMKIMVADMREVEIAVLGGVRGLIAESEKGDRLEAGGEWAWGST